METIFGGLIEFKGRKELIEFTETMDIDTSIKIIEGTLEYGQKNGLYTLEEASVIYKSIYVLKETRWRDELSKPVK